MVEIRIQVGAEAFVKGKRVLRFTPVDKKVSVDPLVALALLTGQRELDAHDDQPGDGEFDHPIKGVDKAILKLVPGADKIDLLPGEQNLFIRVSQAAS